MLISRTRRTDCYKNSDRVFKAAGQIWSAIRKGLILICLLCAASVCKRCKLLQIGHNINFFSKTLGYCCLSYKCVSKSKFLNGNQCAQLLATREEEACSKRGIGGRSALASTVTTYFSMLRSYSVDSVSAAVAEQHRGVSVLSLFSQRAEPQNPTTPFYFAHRSRRDLNHQR